MFVTLVRVPTIIDVSASTAPVCPPIGMAYLKSVVNQFTDQSHVVDSIGNYPEVRTIKTKEGYKVNLLGQNDDEITNEVPKQSDIILVSIMFSQDWLYTKSILQKLREKCPQALIVAGGEHITALHKESMEDAPEIDIAVCGEGEPPLTDILDQYKNHGKVISKIQGVYFKYEPEVNDLSHIKNRVRDINQLDRPDWESFPLQNYFDGGHSFGVSNAGVYSMPMLASRGCPYKCTFCSNEFMWGSYYGTRKVEDVVDEMKYYIDRYKVTNFDFYDLTVIIRRQWIVDFCNLLIENNLNITWQLPSGTRSEAIDDEVCDLLYRSGCRNLSYAPESGSPEVLKLIKKRIKLDRMLTSIRSSVKHNLSVKINIICGFPQEKMKHLIESYGFIIKLGLTGCDDLSINQFSPYPGSELFNDLIRDKQIQLDNHYYKTLSYYSSMTNAHSYSYHLSSRQLLAFKFTGTALFYAVTFLRRPWRVFNVFYNVVTGNETTRLEKTLISMKSRFTTQKAS